MQPGLPGSRSTPRSSASHVHRAVAGQLRVAMLLGIALVALIIIAFLFEWRTAFISLIAIRSPWLRRLILDAAGSHRQCHGARGVGRSHRGGGGRRHHRRRKRGTATPAGAGRRQHSVDLQYRAQRLRRVRSAITYAVVINVIAVVPVLFLAGLSGSFFRRSCSRMRWRCWSPWWWRDGDAGLVPAAAFPWQAGQQGVPLMRVLKRAYGALLAPLIRKPLPAIALTLALLVGGCWRCPRWAASCFPTSRNRTS